MLARIDCLLAGRVGEELLLGNDDVTTGCSDDLRKATHTAYVFVKEVGFSQKMNWISGDGSK
jgi:ATP-dependent metalloprotease